MLPRLLRRLSRACGEACRLGAAAEEMRNEWVRPYYEALAKKRVQLVGKRCFDVALSTILLVLLSPAFLVLAIAVKLDSPGTGFSTGRNVSRSMGSDSVSSSFALCATEPTRWGAR